jgi:hypothetical protein
VQLKKNYNTNGILTTEIDYKKLENTIDKASKKMPFKEAYLKYSELRKSLDFGNGAAGIAAIQPLVVDAYNKLGDDKVRKLRYIKEAIERELINIDKSKSQDEKIAAMVKQAIDYPCRKTCPEITKIIDRAYKTVGIKTIAKAAHITKWFECKKTSAKIDGVTVAVYDIYTLALI